MTERKEHGFGFLEVIEDHLMRFFYAAARNVYVGIAGERLQADRQPSVELYQLEIGPASQEVGLPEDAFFDIGIDVRLDFLYILQHRIGAADDGVTAHPWTVDAPVSLWVTGTGSAQEPVDSGYMVIIQHREVPHRL